MIYEKYGLLFEESPDWKIREVGFAEDNAGDCISRSMQTKNKRYITVCADLLIQRKRWPDEFQEEFKQFIAKNRLDEEWSKLRYKFHKWSHPYRYLCGTISYETKKRRTKKIRHQGSMTRDPYTHYYSTCAEHGFKKLIEIVTVPLYLYRRKLWVWRKYLLTGKERYLRIYERLELRSLRFAHKYYVVDLIMARADGAQSERVWEALANYELEIPDKSGYSSQNKKNKDALISFKAKARAEHTMKLKDVGNTSNN